MVYYVSREKPVSPSRTARPGNPGGKPCASIPADRRKLCSPKSGSRRLPGCSRTGPLPSPPPPRDRKPVFLDKAVFFLSDIIRNWFQSVDLRMGGSSWKSPSKCARLALSRMQVLLLRVWTLHFKPKSVEISFCVSAVARKAKLPAGVR